ncbi:MAG: hypothetical protein Q7U64_04605 [Desulfocapsaceae bacterium]|nr:hypothetical protein [Desulfocapsaceae bacterium]
MEKFIQTFQEKHPGIQVEKETSVEYVMNEEGEEEELEVTIYNITAIPNLGGLTLCLKGENDFKRLEKIIDSKPALFKDFLGGKVGGNVEVVISRVNRFQNPLLLQRFLLKPIKIAIGYKSKTLAVEIHLGFLQKTETGFLAAKMIGIRSQRNRAIAKISGLVAKNLVELESDTRLVLRSILFDIECSYGIVLETANLENLKAPINRSPVPRPRLPKDEITLLYKPYTPELIEYFHTGERVDYLPFKFICYFHIIEYFMDKSAHSVVAKKIKQIILSPDFHARSSEYVSDAIKVFKTETEKFMADKIKISRVFAEYLDKEKIQRFVEDNDLQGHCEKDHTLKCNKDLKVIALKFDSNNSFCETLTRRIYSIRCSIVHSNPDFDETKAVPFSPTPANIDFLRREIELIKEVARTIIVNSIV